MCQLCWVCIVCTAVMNLALEPEKNKWGEQCDPMVLKKEIERVEPARKESVEASSIMLVSTYS
jgi:hypothetical protein